MKRVVLISAAMLGSVAALLLAGGSASAWTLPASFPATPLSASQVKQLPIPPAAVDAGQSGATTPGHCVRFPAPTDCKHANAAPAESLPQSSLRFDGCLDAKTPANDLATQLRVCDKHGKGYVLTFGQK